ncbi:uncharacterized protein LOC114324318 isoform X2 [Diabrotica virgifera virgifera]|uniref:Uncharacterized protein LOC114324318 isoform X2 n=1 Tax=Diabrotica virgifera virgifera TaxID=50390 RepID=A0A6P7F342_DIAVI|nr:uncharacterized protein LOC114324318 isoform X2 [Diabrotica virgifera virgifera]
MTSNTLILLVIVSLFSQSLQDVHNNEIDVDEPNLYKEAASDIKREQNQVNIGGLMKNIMDNGGSDLLGSIMSEIGKEGGGDILEGLGSMLTGDKQGGKKSDSDSPNVLESLGSIASLVGALDGLKDGGKGKENQDGSPDVLKSLGAIGSLLAQGQGNKGGAGALLQGLGSLLGQANEQGQARGQGGEGAAALLQGLGSLLGQANEQGQGQGQGGEGAAALLQGLGSLLGQANDQGEGRAQGGDGAAAILNGLGSLLNQGGAGGQKLDLGSMLNFFASEDEEKPKKKSVGSKKVRKGDPKAESDFNLNDILSLAGSFLGQSGQDGKKGGSNFLSLLPTILQTMNAFVGPEARSREKSHAGHSSLMPPFLEKLHLMFDHFIHSEMGKNTIAALGAEKSFKVFLDDKGRFSYKKFGELMENHSYRRQWIRILTDRIAEFLQYASDPKVYKSYFVTAQVFFNSYLQKEGFPKSTQFDPKRPVETISAFVNYVGKRDFQVNIDSKEYVKPAVLYIKDILKMTEKSGTLKKFSNSNELSSKLADTINLEIIEPLARVNRAIRFAKANPKCDRYVLCLVNEESKNDAETLPGLKKLLYKGASLVGGWFLSSNTGTSFWTLYADITDSKDCKKLYSAECDGFHIEELKVTTEYVHNEL